MVDCIMIILTIVIAFFTFLVWKVYDRIAWLTGAMETHSDLILRIEAKRGIKDGEPIKLIWWDPTIENTPVKREHGQEVDLNTIYIHLPLTERKIKPTWWSRVKQLFQFL